MTDLLPRLPATAVPDATRRGRDHGALACVTRAAELADVVPVSRVTGTSAQQFADDVPERH